MHTRIFVALAIITANSNAAHGRPMPLWPYKVLYSKADLVLIARPVKARDWADGDADIKLPPTYREYDTKYLSAGVTEFRPLVVMKGKLIDAQFAISHYRPNKKRLEADGIIVIRNGPQLVSFNVPRESDPAYKEYPSKYDYILFLKRDPTGSYTFVTGQLAPAFSVMQLTPQ